MLRHTVAGCCPVYDLEYNLSHGMFVFIASYPPTAADSEGPQRARSQDCWPRRAGLSGVPAPGADSPMTTGTQSFQAETV